MGEHYDVAVIGTGPGGYIAALKAAQRGATVAAVEKAEHLGGACLNFGCIPSKALLASAELLHRIGRAGELGVEVAGQVGFDWPKIQQRKDKVLQRLRGGVGSLFKSRSVALYRGRGELDGPGKVVVRKDGAGPEAFTAGKVIVAVGSVPARIPGWPSDPERVCTSDEALHWRTLPKRLLIVGGGYIGCELACMLQPFGVEITLVEMLPRLLPGMDADASEALAKIFAARGITVRTGAKVEDLTEAGRGLKARLSGGQEVEVDKALVSVGRRPDTAEVGLDTVGLTTDGGFVDVDETMATSAKDVYCIGDANGRMMLAHAASAQAVVAVENALGHARTYDAAIPGCVYTFPEVAGVGLTQQKAREAGLPVAVGAFPLNYLGKALAIGETDGFVKVIRHRETGQMLGVHMMGHNVTEVIASAAAMVNQKVTVKDVAETVFAHPTISEALKEAAEDALGMALHLPPRKMMRVAAGGESAKS